MAPAFYLYNMNIIAIFDSTPYQFTGTSVVIYIHCISHINICSFLSAFMHFIASCVSLDINPLFGNISVIAQLEHIDRLHNLTALVCCGHKT